MTELVVAKKNHIFLTVKAEPHVHYELADYFTFDIPNAKFMPQYKSGMWDGKIRLFNVMTGYMYAGLNKYIEDFASKRNYQVEYKFDTSAEEFSVKEANDFIDTLNIPAKFERRDYQVDAFVYAVRNRRAFMLSPTSSGITNALFMKPGGNILELTTSFQMLDREDLHHQYVNLAYSLNHNYHAIQNKDRNADIIINKLEKTNILNIL